jgi:hypothetical protein
VITYYFTDTYGCAGSASHSTSVNYCLNSDEIDVLNGVRLFPNPGSGDFLLEVPVGREQNIELTVTDGTGALYYHENFISGTGSLQHHLKLDYLSNGLYLLKLKYGSSVEKNIKLIQLRWCLQWALKKAKSARK